MACRIAQPRLLRKSGHGGTRSSIIMTQRVKDIKGVLGLLTVIKSTEFER